jgi:hypothetical protein
MAQTVVINVDMMTVLKRLERATWKHGRMGDNPQAVKPTYNLQADMEESADYGLMLASYEKWLWEGISIMEEYVQGTPTTTGSITTITLLMPYNWGSRAETLKQSLLALLYSGMAADWYDEVQPESVAAYIKRANTEKKNLAAIVYAINPPSVTIQSEVEQFDGNSGTEGGNNDNEIQLHDSEPHYDDGEGETET